MEILALCFLAAAAQARSPRKEVISFTYTTNVGAGRALFVVGSHPDLGSWDPIQARRLTNSGGNVWMGQVAVQSGTTLEYKFISRNTNGSQNCTATNVIWQADPNNVTNVLAEPPAPYAGKTIYYYSGLTNVGIIFSSAGGAFTAANMSVVGPGRTGGEFLYKVASIGEAGESIEFVMTGFVGANQIYDHAPYGGYGSSNYYTTLDVFLLQDGNIFNYWPPASGGSSQIVVTNIGSSYGAIPARDVKIYLPRGYGANTWKRYPVLYMHDGQNIFYPDAGLGGSWNANLTADREISQGRMRETIIVGVYANNSGANTRILEYLPPYDSYSGNSGLGDQFAKFLINNVRPTIDAHYRTLNDFANTMTLGSSMGGVISMYLGIATNVFGKIGPMSPAFWISPVLRGHIASDVYPTMRCYMDFGTGNELGDMWDVCWGVYSSLRSKGHVVNRDLTMVIGCGQDHTESAWAARLPGCYRFLLDIWDEPNRLAQRDYPPALGLQTNVTTGVMQLNYASLAGHTYLLESSSNQMSGSWAASATSQVEVLPWATRSFAVTNDDFQGTFRSFRVSASAK